MSKSIGFNELRAEVFATDDMAGTYRINVGGFDTRSYYHFLLNRNVCNVVKKPTRVHDVPVPHVPVESLLESEAGAEGAKKFAW